MTYEIRTMDEEMKTKIAFYIGLKNNSINLEHADISKGNPGVGGTQYLFLLTVKQLNAQHGAEYAQLKSSFNVFETSKNTWGFYVSPEIGFNVYPWAYGPGLHFAAYYSYGTNKGDLFTYSVDGLSNFGLRVGIAF